MKPDGTGETVMPDHLPEPEQVERFTLQKRNGWWNVLDAPPTPTTIEARITTVPLSVLQSQRQLIEEAEAERIKERREAEQVVWKIGKQMGEAERQVSEYREALEEARAEVRRLDQILESHEACAPLHRSKGPDG